MEFHIGQHWIVNILGLNVHMDTLITLWITMAIIIFFALLAVGNLKLIPSKLQAIFENIVTIFSSLTKDMGEEGKRHTPILIALFLFIITGNLIGQVPWKILNFIPAFRLSHGELASPTNDLNLTAALAVLAVICYLVSGVIKKGPVKYLRKFFTPMGLLEVLELVTRPLSLALRLFANILAGEIIIMVTIGLLAVFLPIPLMLFEVFVAFIQAFIFSVLTASYIAGAVSDEH